VLWVKWKLMLATLPYVAGMVALNIAIAHSGWFEGVIDFADIGLVLTGGIFLIGFMLAGTMADYKEAERLPAELATALETVEETFAQAAVAKPVLDAGSLRARVLGATDTVLAWLHHRASLGDAFAGLEDLSAAARDLEQAGAGALGIRALNELNALRKAVTRISVISRTGFLASGYALLEVLTGAVLLLLLVAKFKSLVAEIILVAFVTLIYVYMLRLIKDIDDPFEYSADGTKGAAEVELTPLTEYRERLKGRTSQA
jgi:hypothetical protein